MTPAGPISGGESDWASSYGDRSAGGGNSGLAEVELQEGTTDAFL